MANGVIYILTQNERYVDMALQSVASLKRAMPEQGPMKLLAKRLPGKPPVETAGR